VAAANRVVSRPQLWALTDSVLLARLAAVNIRKARSVDDSAAVQWAALAGPQVNRKVNALVARA
jgi:hypothetical protein